jgi:hypothetical protein
MHLIPRPNHARRLATIALVAIATAACGGSSGSAREAAGSPLGRSLPDRLAPTTGKYVFFVDGTHGSDSNRGSRRRPWKTIERALRTVPLSGSVIKVLPGTYTSTGSNYAISFHRKGDVRDPITLEPAVPGTVTIENGDPSRTTIGGWIADSSGLRIRGLRFRVLTRRASNVGATALLIENSDRIEIARCTFNEVSMSGIEIRGGIQSTSDDVWVINNVFRPSGEDPTGQVTGLGYGTGEYFGSKGSHWIYAGQYGKENTWEQVSGSRRLVIVNNVFAGSAAGRDVQLGPQARNSFVVNNTFYGNRSADVIGHETDARYAGQAVELFSNSSNPAFVTGYNTIANNLFVNLQGAAVSGSGPAEPGNVVLDNLSWDVIQQSRPGGGDFAPINGEARIFLLAGRNRTLEPRLLDPRRYQFALRRGSPALHTAAPNYAYPWDAGGRLRPAAPAIGAFEQACPPRKRSTAAGGSC